MSRLRLLLGCLLLAGCLPDETELAGAWQAVGFYENGQASAAPIDSVRLVLNTGGSYVFSTVGQYREKGLYRLSLHYLFLQDTTQEPSPEHILKILYLSRDSMKLQMESGGQEQVLFLKRIDQPGM